MRRTCICLLTSAATPVLAQSNVDPVHKYSWSENCGWMNWRDAGSPTSSQGAVIGTTFMYGYVWLENAGWLKLGGGTPANGFAYSNTTGPDTGVNIAPSGNLSGFAWGENVGWVNFDTAAALAPFSQHARVSAGRLRGYAWGENIGWINLDDATNYVAAICYANCDGSSVNPVLNANDFQCFLNKFAAGDAYGNCDGSTAAPILNINDFQCFINKFAIGCT